MNHEQFKPDDNKLTKYDVVFKKSYSFLSIAIAN